MAHYCRLLESAGVASSARNVGGIGGSERVIVWYDLDQAWLGPPDYVESAPASPLSAMERYDLEFAHRPGVHLAADEHAGGDDTALLAEPVACDDFGMCT